MTYCLAICINKGLVLASDSRTNAGVDDISTYSKMHVFALQQRCFVLLSAGNLATTQLVVRSLQRDLDEVAAVNLQTVANMDDATKYIGGHVVQAQQLPGNAPRGVNVEASFLLGGQIAGFEPSIHLIYPQGNSICSSPENPFFQIGESKYGKPILDRTISADLSLEDAARCALVSLDSTMRSNVTVGPPIELAILPRDSLQLVHRGSYTMDSPFYRQLTDRWRDGLRQVFQELPRFEWESSS